MTIGEKIKRLRKQKDLTQKELAEMCGYKSLTTINKIELGINSVPLSVIEKLAFSLEVTPAYLMGWEDNLGQDKKIEDISNEEKKLVSLIGQLTEEETKELASFVDYLISKRK